MNAILYGDRTGVQWRYLPHDFPPWGTVYGCFAKRQKEWGDVFAQLNGVLRELVRRKEGRHTGPSACVIDARSAKTSVSVLAASQGTDAGEKIVGRKRSIVTDTLGLLPAVLVTSADGQDFPVSARSFWLSRLLFAWPVRVVTTVAGCAGFCGWGIMVENRCHE